MKNKLLFILIILISFQTTQAQWSQIGSDIYGQSVGDYSGTSVSMSADGSIVAIGSPYNDDNGEDSGQVRVYKNIAGSWTQMGADIEGDPIWGYSGWSVSLSADGLTLAIGAPEAYDETLSYAGQVKIFRYTASSWLQIGDSIIGELQYDDHAGNAVSLSADGSIIAIASYGLDHFRGRVRVFENQADVWVQIGDSMDGSTIGEEFGNSLEITNDGTTLVVGAPNYANNGIGYVKVFKNIAGEWVQVGATINGDELNARFGWAVSINETGDRIAVSAPYHEVRGITKVFQNNSGVWEQIGDDIYDEINDDNSGYAICFNDDGSKIVISSRRAYGSRGQVCLYQENTGVWEQLGNCIIGDEASDYSGTDVCLTNDGSKLAIGAPKNDANGDYSGQVKVFQFTSSSGTDDLVEDKLSIYPNPFKDTFTLNSLNNSIKKITITDYTGKIVKTLTNTKQNNSIDLSGVSNGFYMVNVFVNNKVIAKKIIKKQ